MPVFTQASVLLQEAGGVRIRTGNETALGHPFILVVLLRARSAQAVQCQGIDSLTERAQGSSRQGEPRGNVHAARLSHTGGSTRMLKLAKTKHTIAMTAAALAIAGGTTVGFSGTANAASDTYTVDHVELILINNDSTAGNQQATICNWQSAYNTFWFWVKDDTTGHLAALDGSPYEDIKYELGMDAGQCLTFTVTAAYGHTLQEFFSTNGVTYGTNPVTFN